MPTFGSVKVETRKPIEPDERMESSQPGIFVAGDVRSQFVRQITNAVGDATTAAIAATKLLEALEHEGRSQAAPDQEAKAILEATAGQYP